MRRTSSSIKHSAPAKVFISYSHDSRAHAQRMLALANRLRREGVDASIDQYEHAPGEGWTLWMEKQIRDADYVLLCCTEVYLRRVMKEEFPGTGLGVCWESNIIYQHLYEDGTQNKRFIPVIAADGDRQFIPMPLRTFTRYSIHTADGYEALYQRLIGRAAVSKPPLGKVRARP